MRNTTVVDHSRETLPPDPYREDRGEPASSAADAPSSSETAHPSVPRRTYVLLHRYEPLLITAVVAMAIVRIAGGTLVGAGQPALGSPLLAAAPPPTSAAAPTPSGHTPTPPPAVLPAQIRPTDVAPSMSRTPTETAVAPAPGTTRGPRERLPRSATLRVVSAFAALPSPGQPVGIAVGPHGNVWATSGDSGSGTTGSTLFELGRSGHLLASLHLRGASGLGAAAFGPARRLYVLSDSPAAVWVVNPTSHRVRKFATIPDVSPCVPVLVQSDCDESVIDAAPHPSALAFDRRQRLYVADATQGIVWRIPARGGTAVDWLADSSWVNPTRPSGPTGLAFDGVGNLVIALAGDLQQDAGSVYLQAINRAGSPGARTELASTGSSTRPTAVALGASGRVYVSLSGSGVVLVLSPRGRALRTFPSGADHLIDTPAGLAFDGTSLLVAEQAPSHPAGGRVLRVRVGEKGERSW